MDIDSGKAFDLRLFKRLVEHTKPYRITFYAVALTAIFLSLFAVAGPYILQLIIDDAITTPDAQKLL